MLAVLALGACGERAPLAQACIEAQPQDVLQALTDAPGTVALADGTPISRCVEHAIEDAQLQALGTKLTGTADVLAALMHDGDRDAALQLGFLIGAVTRGSARTAGFQSDLVDRIANAAGLGRGPHREALLEGRAAGRRRG